MKLLTLNTHSLIGADGEARLASLSEGLAEEAPDVAALQEVSQSIAAPLWRGAIPKNFHACGATVPLRADNAAARLVQALAERGLTYHWVWLPVKVGYDRYDEGLAILSQAPPADIRAFPVSRCDDYRNWRRRMALGVRPEGSEAWFYCLHMSWWQDKEEPFAAQWERLCEGIADTPDCWLMGDMNNPAEVRGEGYDRILCSGFEDAFTLAKCRNGAETVRGEIDGWHGRCTGRDRFRIDHIWCRPRHPVRSCRTAFNGTDRPPLSDHFGVIAEI